MALAADRGCGTSVAVKGCVAAIVVVVVAAAAVVVIGNVDGSIVGGATATDSGAWIVGCGKTVVVGAGTVVAAKVAAV